MRQDQNVFWVEEQGGTRWILSNYWMSLSMKWKLRRSRRVLSPKLKAEADNTLRDLRNSSYHMKAEFSNCFIFILNISRALKTQSAFTGMPSEAYPLEYINELIIRNSNPLVNFKNAFILLEIQALINVRIRIWFLNTAARFELKRRWEIESFKKRHVQIGFQMLHDSSSNFKVGVSDISHKRSCSWSGKKINFP